MNAVIIPAAPGWLAFLLMTCSALRKKVGWAWIWQAGVQQGAGRTEMGLLHIEA